MVAYVYRFGHTRTSRGFLLTPDLVSADESLKRQVEAFWEAASCGEVYMEGPDLAARLEAQAAARYRLEPYIFDFADFPDARGKRVLEIGVGMGADHLQWARERPSDLVGIDLTGRALNFTRSRLRMHGLDANVAEADAESLPFDEGEFDIVYSWGVIHHSPDTPRAVAEIRRVLRKGGKAKIMIYHSRSIVGYLLWLRYGLLRGRPWSSRRAIYARYLESPGTKAYSVGEARSLFCDFASVTTHIELSAGDLLEGEAGQRHRGRALSVARLLWPRGLIRRACKNHGLFLMIQAVK